MRLLIAIPHYYRDHGGRAPHDGRFHASVAGDAASRVAALRACIAAAHQLFGPAQRIIDQVTLIAHPANELTAGQVDIVVCTQGDAHLLGDLGLPPGTYAHRPTECPPQLLGFECHAALRDGLGRYDYYAYLEDDLVCRDPWMLHKLDWFNRHLGDELLLQPNRYEVRPPGFVVKAYLDGALRRELTAAYQDLDDTPELASWFLGQPLTFRRPSNPHAGCFFLNARQMQRWAARSDFLDRATDFIGPLESAATLGVLRAFRIYKPSLENANFLEIEHHGTAFIDQLRLRDPAPGTS